ncbi:hypothetical protein HMPREF2580_02420 [Staphylococcus sp. HMSC036D05]|nr:hypothetical protein HMPREF2580_02420 [Staphylococcus sp. HMSC036D05]
MINKKGAGQKYNLTKLISFSLSQLSLFVEFLKKKFSMLGPRRQGWLGLKKLDESALSIQTSTANMLKETEIFNMSQSLF